MTSSAMSASTPRSRPVGTTRRDSIIPADTARLVTCRFPPQSSGHPKRSSGPRTTAAGVTSRHPRQTDPVGPSADEGHWARCPHRGVLGLGECALSAAGRADTPRNREAPVEHAPSLYSRERCVAGDPSAWQFGVTDVSPVTGHVAVAQPSWRGRVHDVRQDRQLYAVICLRSAPRRPLPTSG
jgi:hypothetical protein